MEKFENYRPTYEKVGSYEGHTIYTANTVPRECVARIGPDPKGSIVIHPEAFKILKSRPDYLERIYKHEVESGFNHEEHDCEDKDILRYLKENGYDFGQFEFSEAV